VHQHNTPRPRADRLHPKRRSAPKPKQDVAPPRHSDEDERQLLGKLLVKPSLARAITLPIEAFESDRNRTLYAAIVDLAYNDADGSNFATKLCRALGPSRLSDIGGTFYIGQLVSSASEIIDHTYEVERLTAAMHRRRALAELSRIQEGLQAGADPRELLESSRRNLKCLREIPPGTRVACGDRGNIGEVLSDNGDTCTVHFVSPEGIEVDKDLSKDVLTPLDGRAAAAEAILPSHVSQMRAAFPLLDAPIIHGMLRRSEVGGIIAQSKMGKSWLMMELALCAGFGWEWMGFKVDQSRVLLMDNELKPATQMKRLEWLAEKRGVELNTAPIFAVSMRGKNKTLLTIEPTMRAVAGQFDLIILDAWYRFIPKGYDENSNSDMIQLFNKLDEYAEVTGAAILVVHHASKGNQGGKAVVDVGAGAGSQSRAVDCHMVIREHEQPGVFVVDAACRSFPPLDAFCIERTGLTWERADGYDPKQLKRDRPARQKPDGTPAEPVAAWTAERFAMEFVVDQPRPQKMLEAMGREKAGLSIRQVLLLLEQIREQELCHVEMGKGRRPTLYSAQPFPQQRELVA
jgi:hypothetical protein